MRKKEEEREKENSERWMLTYSDMITLLLALFIMMYTMSTVDTSKFKALSEQLGIALGQGSSIEQVDSGGGNQELLNNIEMAAVSPSSSPSSSATGTGSGTQSGTREDIEDKLKSLVDSSGIGKVVTVHSEMRGIVVSFQEALLFPSGSAYVSNKGRDVLKKMSAIINSVDNYISIEGSTDNVPISSARFPSNWELASQRAINVTKILINDGVGTERIAPTSFAEYRPIVNNDSDDNKARNRRVDIVFIDQKFNDLQAGYNNPDGSKTGGTDTSGSTSPASTNPASTNPASTNPASTTPASTTPASTNPASTNPASTNPASTTPASTTPANTNPANTS